MSERDLERGMASLADNEVRAKVADGDLAAPGELELTDEEQALLQAAASDEADVVGFGINTGLLGFSPTQKVAGFEVTVNKARTADKAHAQMDSYIKQ
jgi:hypothetical protein